MRAKTVNETLNERRYRPDPRDQEVRFSNRPGSLDSYYNIDDRGRMKLKSTKERAQEERRQEAIKRLEIGGIVKAKFPATPAGVKQLEDWAYSNAEDTDYVLRPGDLPTDGSEIDIVVYDDSDGLGTKITDDLRKDYSKAMGADYYNARPIKIENWMDLDPLHKLRSRREEKEDREELVPDIIGKMD
jgi:hypothetical protein